MVGNVIDARSSSHHDPSSTNHTESILNESSRSTSGSWSAEDKEKILLSVTLCLVVGIMQVMYKKFFCKRDGSYSCFAQL